MDGKPDLSKFAERYQTLEAEAAKRAEAQANVPEDGAYAFDLPADFKIEGFEDLKLDLTNEAYQPLLADAAALLKDLGAPKDAGSKLATLIARLDTTRYSMAAKAAQAEREKLGTPAQFEARKATLARALETKLPAETAAAIMGLTQNAAAFRGLEALLASKDMGTSAPRPAAKSREQMISEYYAKPTR